MMNANFARRRGDDRSGAVTGDAPGQRAVGQTRAGPGTHAHHRRARRHTALEAHAPLPGRGRGRRPRTADPDRASSRSRDDDPHRGGDHTGRQLGQEIRRGAGAVADRRGGPGDGLPRAGRQSELEGHRRDVGAAQPDLAGTHLADRFVRSPVPLDGRSGCPRPAVEGTVADSRSRRSGWPVPGPMSSKTEASSRAVLQQPHGPRPGLPRRRAGRGCRSPPAC